MENNRTYSVYVHKVDTADNGPMWYVGMSSNIKNRWQPSLYKCKSLWPYIQEYGWENMEHRIVADGLDYELACKFEDALIRMYRIGDCCINERRSGLIATKKKDVYYNKWYEDHREEHNAYSKQYYEEHREELKAYNKQYNEEHREEKKAHNRARRSTPDGKIYNRVASFNQRHPDRMTETPKEARDKYLSTGYIPDYIKNNDLS